MKMKNAFLVLLLASLLFTVSCTSIPQSGPFVTQKITTGYGPEDMALDTLTNPSQPRILVSCDTRREREPQTNGIYVIDIQTDSVSELRRVKEPEDLNFHPHGISYVLIDSVPRLFVISHDDENNKQLILRYKVFTDSLQFEARYQNTLFISPNDIFALENGTFFFTNDAGKRNSFTEKLFRLKRSSVVYYPRSLRPYYIDDELCYANGVYYKPPYLYVSTVLENTVYKYTLDDFKVVEKEVLAEVKGGDNIMPYKNKLLVAAHLKPIAFLRHKKNPDVLSPSVIYEIDTLTGEKSVLFSDDGSLISAASTGLRYGKYLYVSQVFDNFVLKVEMKD